MGDFYVDDAFFDHPKAISAGEDACSLYVRGLAWAHRHNTGRIPKDALDQLTRKPRPKLLAERLAAVAPGQTHPLWHDRGDFYEIHDWDTRNAKVVARRQHAKEAAEERWRRARPTLPMAMPEHPPGNARADALAVQSECLTNQGTKDQGAAAADPMPTRNGGGMRPAAAAGPDREKPEAGTKPQVSVVDEALRLLAERRLAAHRGPVDNPGGWLRRAVEGLRSDLAQRIAQSEEMQLVDAGMPAALLADWLEPAQVPRAENGAGERRDYDLERPSCETCEGSGWVEQDDGTVVRCAHPASVP